MAQYLTSFVKILINLIILSKLGSFMLSQWESINLPSFDEIIIKFIESLQGRVGAITKYDSFVLLKTKTDFTKWSS